MPPLARKTARSHERRRRSIDKNGRVTSRRGRAHRRPSSVTIKATGEDTSGTFYLGEAIAAPDFAGTPPHVHDRLHDTFYVLEGTLTLWLDDDTVECEPGTFFCVPPGVVHTFGNQTQAPVRFLNFNTPAGWENYMRDLSEALAAGHPPIGRWSTGGSGAKRRRRRSSSGSRRTWSSSRRSGPASACSMSVAARATRRPPPRAPVRA